MPLNRLSKWLKDIGIGILLVTLIQGTLEKKSSVFFPPVLTVKEKWACLSFQSFHVKNPDLILLLEKSRFSTESLENSKGAFLDLYVWL